MAHGKSVAQQKRDAQALISKLYVLPVLPGASQILAKGLVQADPMGYFTEPQHYTAPTRVPIMPPMPPMPPNPVESIM